jgi:hypothetical protein
MLRVRTLLLGKLTSIDGQPPALAKSDPVTRLLVTPPGVGVIVALTLIFQSAVDDPDRFPRSRDHRPRWFLQGLPMMVTLL